MRAPRAGAVIVGLALLVPPASSVAAEVLLYGPGAPDADGAARAQGVFAAAVGRAGPSGGVSHVLDLPFPSQDALWVAGGVLTVPCTDPSLQALDPRAALDEGIRRMDHLDQDGALSTFDCGVRALPCSSAPVERRTLARLHLYAGIAAFQSGKRAQANREFAAAFAADTKTVWDSAYPPDAQQVWLEAKEAALTGGTVPLHVDARGATVGSLSLDGEAIALDRPVDLQLYPGSHLLRYVSAEGGVVARLLEVQRGGGVVTSRPALREAVLNAAWGSGGVSAALASLRELCRARGVGEAYVVSLGDAPRIYRYRAGDGTVAALVVDSGALANAERGGLRRNASLAIEGASERAGRGSLGLGAGVHVQDTVPYALVALHAHARVVAGLELGGGLQVALRPYDLILGEHGTLVLPALLGDLRYRLPLGQFHPWAGVRGLLGLTHPGYVVPGANEEVSPTGGIAGLLGFDVTPLAQRGFTVHLDAAIGYAGDEDRQGFLLDVTGGVGLRF
jgi:hypothetical protein